MMSESKIGPKEQQLRDMRAAKATRKPVVADLRKQIAAAQARPPKPKKAKKKAGLRGKSR
jgi:hypothetical protein